MRVHHLDCISSCPLGGHLMDGRSGVALRGRLACHCLLIEGSNSLILVDTGFGLHDVASPRPRLSRLFLTLLRPELRVEMTAIRQIQALGFDPGREVTIACAHDPTEFENLAQRALARPASVGSSDRLISEAELQQNAGARLSGPASS